MKPFSSNSLKRCLRMSSSSEVRGISGGYRGGAESSMRGICMSLGRRGGRSFGSSEGAWSGVSDAWRLVFVLGGFNVGTEVKVTEFVFNGFTTIFYSSWRPYRPSDGSPPLRRFYALKGWGQVSLGDKTGLLTSLRVLQLLRRSR